MRIPQIFVPEKSLDYKIKELYEDPKERLDSKIKEHLIDSSFYEVVSRNLKALLDTPKSPVRTLWVSDRHKTSRYEGVEEIINEIIKMSGKTIAYEIYNYYDKKFERKNIYTILEAYYRYEPPVQIVYVNHKITEELKRERENAPLFDRLYLIHI